MEYLNPSPAAALPQAMWLTYSAVMERPASNSETLLDLLVPTALRPLTPGEGSHVKRALSALLKLGLISENSGSFTAEKVAGPQEFLRQVRHRIVQPPEKFGPGYEGADDIRRGLVWLMRQSPARALDFKEDVEEKNADLEKVFVNQSRWNTFRMWCDVLGFGQTALDAMAKDKAGSRIVPNPSRAVVDAIAHPFGEALPRGEQLPIGRLVEFLREELPVLPGHPSAVFDGVSDDDSALRVVGHALSTAEEMNVLTLSYQSDPSGVMALPNAQDGGTRYVSAVTIRK